MTTGFIEPNFENIPMELRKLPRWVTWHAEGRPGEKPRKVPYAPNRANTKASSTDAQTWGTFDQAEGAYLDGGCAGVGIVLNGDGLVGVDIDHCVADGKPSEQAAALLDKLGAGYIEISPSGTGLRAIGYGEQLTAGVNGSLDGLKAEFYSTSRYLTLTGKTIKAGPIVPLVGFKAVAESFRAIKKAKVNASTGELEQTRPDERHTAMVRGILSGDVYHDNLRDLAASLVATGMQAGAVVNHLSGLMDASTGPHDDRWAARRQQIPELVNSAVAKFVPQPLDFSILQRLSGEVQQDGEHDVSIANLGTFAPVPPQFWIDEILPADVVTLLGAHGGAGKTTLAIVAAVCCAMGLPFLGKSTKPANVLLYSAEDDSDLLRWRLLTVCERLTVDPVALADRLSIVDASDTEPVMFVEARRNGVTVGEPTAVFKKLIERMAASGAQVVILDNASDVYGADENNRGQVRAFIRLLGKLVRPMHGAVMLLAHVDKLTARTGGSQGYSGSTAWHNSVRSRLFMSDDKDGFVNLEHQKSNRGQRAEPMRLIWDRGLPMLAQEVAGASGSLKPMIDSMRQSAIVGLIAEFYSRGEWVSTSPTAHTNAFKMLSGESAFPKGMTKTDLWQLLRDSERRRVIGKETYKSNGRKDLQRWCAHCAPSLRSHDDGA